MDKRSSIVSIFDDMQRRLAALTDGNAERELLRMLQSQEKSRLEILNKSQQPLCMQKEVDASARAMADLEKKLLEIQTKSRRAGEALREVMEKEMEEVLKFLQFELKLNAETKGQIADPVSLKRDILPVGNRNEQYRESYFDFPDPVPSGPPLSRLGDDFLYTNCVGTEGNFCEMPVASSASPEFSPEKALESPSLEQSALEEVPGTDRTWLNTQRDAGNGASSPKAENYGMTLNTPEYQNHQKEPNPVLSTENSATKIVSPLTSARDRIHNFDTTMILFYGDCIHCQQKICFDAIGERCQNCSLRCHISCQPLLNVVCEPKPAIKESIKLMHILKDYAPVKASLVPPLIVRCVDEIETRMFPIVATYRVPGIDCEIEYLKQRDRIETIPQLVDAGLDIVCDCIMEFLRSLPEPLIPNSLCKGFCDAIDDSNEENVERGLIKAVEALPPTNRATLAFLVIHFRRWSERGGFVHKEMIARVFGSTIVGFSSSDPNPFSIFTEYETQYSIMLNLFNVEDDCWEEFLVEDLQKSLPNTDNQEGPLN